MSRGGGGLPGSPSPTEWGSGSWMPRWGIPRHQRIENNERTAEEKKSKLYDIHEPTGKRTLTERQRARIRDVIRPLDASCGGPVRGCPHLLLETHAVSRNNACSYLKRLSHGERDRVGMSACAPAGPCEARCVIVSVAAAAYLFEDGHPAETHATNSKKDTQ